MNINADLSQRAYANSSTLPWTPSPLAGVDRRMLERDGDEVARATSVVRYAPRSSFSAHVHAKGEEFLVLSGVFSDDTGDFQQGMYVRNPPSSRHTPSSANGCEIFVKLRQMHPHDREQVRIDTHDRSRWRPRAAGGAILSLYSGFGEEVCLLAWSAGQLETCSFTGGAEYFVIDGMFEDEQDEYGPGAWLRLPAGSKQSIKVTEETIVYRKTGHLSGAH